MYLFLSLYCHYAEGIQQVHFPLSVWNSNVSYPCVSYVNFSAYITLVIFLYPIEFHYMCMCVWLSIQKQTPGYPYANFLRSLPESLPPLLCFVSQIWLTSTFLNSSLCLLNSVCLLCSAWVPSPCTMDKKVGFRLIVLVSHGSHSYA